ncbi:hypothetical protein GCM10011519_16830 [Marmoricola endophyticus]|uniref:Sulfotransferase domain-containing protein n=1 Tax=Marmoricola endophyticus TaxID=2040280 RepID=A0A917BIA6_9ACTN|nr:sulfotransferase [Marmoricola endophyticus]GGF43623.1 hypothetical protein GCM10011519_16830 [Marmoricola endophyticus]
MNPAPTPLPAFLGIGALKAGTTYLDSLLRDHPGLSFPTHLKEADYFSRHHPRGEQWYAGLFAPDDGRLRGEISPQYVSHPEAPDRVLAANPEVRLLVSVRHPVDRVVSQYRHWVQETGYRGDLATFLSEHPNAVDRSRYARDLRAWVDRFGAAAIHLVDLDDLRTDPARTARTAAEFLGVATPDTWQPTTTGETNASVAPRFPRAYAAAKAVSRRLTATGHAGVVDRVKSSAPARALKRGRQGVTAAPVPDAILADLGAALADEADRLTELLDRPVGTSWRAPTA